MVLLPLGKPLVVVGGLDPEAVEGGEHPGQQHQEGKQQAGDQAYLTCGDGRTDGRTDGQTDRPRSVVRTGVRLRYVYIHNTLYDTLAKGN